MTFLHYAFLLQLLWHSACNNIAKDYGEAVMPGAKCERLKTYYIGSGYDSAICRWGTEIYVCHESHDVPHCAFLYAVKPERP